MRVARAAANPGGDAVFAAITDDGDMYRLPVDSFPALLEAARGEGESPQAWITARLDGQRPFGKYDERMTQLPVAPAEVWAAGVTYERSRSARSEAVGGAAKSEPTIYDKVYEAERPELFFKSTASRLAAPGGQVRLRSDSNSQVPEPELVLVLDREGKIAGYTAGNDMSARDIEKDNALYIPQAKIWNGSCSIGPAIRLADPEENPYEWTIRARIVRGDAAVWEADASVGQLKRKLTELAEYLFRDNVFEDGTCLFTGTCIVPPEPFTLASGDRIEITIDRIGTLVNEVK
ncbi:fumarylacetoacetate hydrolase family protein [Paenibacillus sacheonensis]|uniref:Fumarylacetoacetate hydrolase n=1 Tax=Paenibacillus sacheonensis TaxID=742054 RepID=A0A7X4YR02_9BACL|nr:fumarylacetoacetate hydrolase family protein [Paenibacillus sacheonensis]MBM7567142.1 2-dehydro-3-deoxy-D-arabinonate dehydratase [Paenibacillus sacheonensis]NBC70933.1 fumarylacetoacetate hydrolase [Paenibacillus sacheonensis]